MERMKKITDEELIDLWSKGFNDIQIAKKFKMNYSVVRRIRIKLKLVANIYPRLTTHRDFEKSIKNYNERQKKREEKLETKQRHREYEQRPETKQMRKEHKKKYYQKMKQKRSGYNQWIEKN